MGPEDGGQAGGALVEGQVRELVRRFPGLRSLPHVALSSLETPVEPAPELAAEANVGEVWIKRDDLTAPLYGGNKVRRLEWLLGEARAQGARGVWTPGSVGSNHLLATTIFGRRLGLDVRLWHYPQPVTVSSAPGIELACRMEVALGAHVELGPAAWLPWVVARARWRARRSRRPGHWHVLPGGGSSPLGALGYVEAALELGGQVARRELPEPDAVVVPVGSGGTLAGLVVGLALAELDVPVIGVRVVDRIVVNRLNLGRLIRGTARLLRRHGLAVPARAWRRRYRLDHRQFGDGYGRPTEAAARAVEWGSVAGLELETTYSGKALAGLLASGREWVGRRGCLLFVVTANSRPLDALVAGEGIRGELKDVELPPVYHRVLGRRLGG